MNWQPPKTEEEWENCLSAFLDDELPEEEKVALEQELSRNSHRANQLAELRRLSGLLVEYSVEVPAPSPEFVHEFKKLREDSSDTIKQVHSPTRRTSAPFHWLPQAAIFLIGVLAGGLGVKLGSSNNQAGKLPPSEIIYRTPPPAQQEVSPPIRSYDLASQTISPDQAEGLLQGMGAGLVQERLLEQLAQVNLNVARQAYEKFRQKFPDIEFLDELESNQEVRRWGLKLLLIKRRWTDE